MPRAARSSKAHTILCSVMRWARLTTSCVRCARSAGAAGVGGAVPAGDNDVHEQTGSEGREGRRRVHQGVRGFRRRAVVPDDERQDGQCRDAVGLVCLGGARQVARPCSPGLVSPPSAARVVCVSRGLARCDRVASVRQKKEK